MVSLGLTSSDTTTTTERDRGVPTLTIEEVYPGDTPGTESSVEIIHRGTPHALDVAAITEAMIKDGGDAVHEPGTRFDEEQLQKSTTPSSEEDTGEDEDNEEEFEYEYYYEYYDEDEDIDNEDSEASSTTPKRNVDNGNS